MARWGNESHCLHTMAKWGNAIGNSQRERQLSRQCTVCNHQVRQRNSLASIHSIIYKFKSNQNVTLNVQRERQTQSRYTLNQNLTSNLHREYWGIWVSPFWLVDENLTTIREFRWPFRVSSSRERAARSIDFIQGSSEATELTIGNGIDILTSMSLYRHTVCTTTKWGKAIDILTYRLLLHTDFYYIPTSTRSQNRGTVSIQRPSEAMQFTLCTELSLPIWLGVYDRFHYQCCAPEIHQIEKLRFLGTNSN